MALVREIALDPATSLNMAKNTTASSQKLKRLKMKLTTDEIQKISDELQKLYPSVVARKISDSELTWTEDSVRVASTVKTKDSVETTYARKIRGRYRVFSIGGPRSGAASK